VYQWLTQLWQQEAGRISAQVMNQYYVTVTQKLKPGLSREQARSDLRALGVWQPLEISTAFFDFHRRRGAIMISRYIYS